MPQRVTDPDTGEKGYLHTIGGKQRFIADDPANSPAAGMGPIDAALVGFGETISNTGLRLQAATDTLSGEVGTDAQKEFRQVKELLGPLEDDHAFAMAIGQSAPGFLLPSSKAVQTVGGVAEGMLADPENPILGGLLGGAGGFIGGAIGERLARSVAARASGAAGRLAARNIPTTLAQRTGSETEKGIEAGLQAIPVISSWAARPARAQQRALDTGVSSVFGYEGKLTSKGLGDVKFGMQKSFSEVQAAIPDQVLDPALLSRIDDSGAMDQATKEFMEASGGILDGEALMSIRSNLNADMADAFLSADRKKGRALRGTLDEVDKIIEGGIGMNMTKQWQTARKQWQFFTAITRGKAVGRDGSVNLATMNNSLDKIYPSFRFDQSLPGTAKGFGELVQALDELPKALQSSGSAERVAAAAVLTGAGYVEPTTLAAPLLAAGRAVGQPGVDVGATAGIAAAQSATDALEDTPVNEAIQDIMERRNASGDVEPE